MDHAIKRHRAEKEGVMRNCLGMLIFSLVLLAATVPCRGESAANAISGEEYGIYRLVIAKLARHCSVDSETLAGIRIDPGTAPAGGIQLDPDMVEDFKVKNIKAYKLAATFVNEMETGSNGGLEGRQKATFSRIGFDREKHGAVLILGLTLYYTEDIMNEGQYVFLEKKSGKWTIVKTARAWNTQLGLIR